MSEVSGSFFLFCFVLNQVCSPSPGQDKYQAVANVKPSQVSSHFRHVQVSKSSHFRKVQDKEQVILSPS